jgi:hypothetical protein
MNIAKHSSSSSSVSVPPLSVSSSSSSSSASSRRTQQQQIAQQYEWSSDPQIPRRTRCYATYSILKLMAMIAILLMAAVHRKQKIESLYGTYTSIDMLLQHQLSSHHVSIERETKDKCGACLRHALVSPSTLFEFGQCSKVFPPAERMGVSNLLT